MTQYIRYTREQILAEWELAKQLVLSAKLKNTDANAHILIAEIKNRGLAPTADNFYKVIKQMLFEGKLEWQIEPERLAARRQDASPANITLAQGSQEQWESNAKAAEAAEARATREAEFERATIEMIDNFAPINRRGQVDYARKTEIQNHLRKYVEEQKARGASMESVKGIIEDYIRKLYEAIERTMTLMGE